MARGFSTPPLSRKKRAFTWFCPDPGKDADLQSIVLYTGVDQVRDRSQAEPHLTGVEVEMEIPLFENSKTFTDAANGDH